MESGNIKVNKEFKAKKDNNCLVWVFIGTAFAVIMFLQLTGNTTHQKTCVINKEFSYCK